MEPQDRPGLLFAGTAAFALFWTIARARIQSITIDEADTYLSFVGAPAGAHWIPSSNNHVLNSMLMRLTTLLFGVSNLTLRLPALLGALVYIVAVMILVRLLTRSVLLGWVLFACLVFNPMVMDHLVAARGYSLALACLMAAIAVAAHGQARYSDPRKTCAIASVLVALSFSANFSFALVDAVTLAGIAWWCLPGKRTWRDCRQIAAAAILPGLLVALYLTGTVLAHWSKNDLRWGATFFVWSMKSISEQCFTQLSHDLVNQPLYDLIVRHRHWLLPLLGLACLWRLAVLASERNSTTDAATSSIVRLGLLAATGAVLSLALHGLLFWTIHLLWPLGRTGLYLPPLCMLAVGALAALPCASPWSNASRRAITALLTALACYFILCLRLTWFEEWQFDAHSDKLYSVVAYYNHTYGVRRIAVNWKYVAVLNYYRTLSGHEDLEPVQLDAALPMDRSLYVLYPADDRAFVEREALKIVYHDDLSDAWIAIRPQLETERKADR